MGHHVEHGHSLVLVHGVTGCGHHTNEYDDIIEQSDCSKMGGAGGEGNLVALS